MPDNTTDPVPVVILQGWGCSPRVFREGMRVLNEQGRRVLMSAHENTSRIPGFAKVDIPGVDDGTLRRAGNVLHLLEHVRVRRVDIIAYSQGANDAAVFASRYPEKVRTLVLYAPAGLHGKDTFFRLVKGGLFQVRFRTPSLEFPPAIPETPVARAMEKMIRRTTATYIWKHPLRALREVVSITRIRTRDALQKLQRQGVRIFVFAPIDDTSFPANAIQQTLRHSGVPIFPVRGGHMQILTDPDPYIYAIAAFLRAKEAVV